MESKFERILREEIERQNKKEYDKVVKAHPNYIKREPVMLPIGKSPRMNFVKNF